MPARLHLSRPLIIWLMIWLVVSVAGVWAKGADPAPNSDGPVMRIMIVRSTDTTCGDRCPEWISAEGTITKDVPAAFHQIFKQLGTRQLPILVHSPGGDLGSAHRIARAIRRHHLDVIVARTWFEGCGAGSATCPADHEIKGLPMSYGAVCASACSLVFAGGEHRYVPTLNRIGVHRPHRVTDARNGRMTAAPLSSAIETRYMAMLREEMTQFFVGMGVSDHIVDLSLETPSTDIRWLTRGQLLDLKLVTNLTGGDGLIAGLRPKEQVAAVHSVQSVKLPSTAPVATFETATAYNVTVNAVHALDFVFSHRKGDPDVNLTVSVRRFGLLQPGRLYALRVEFDADMGSAISASSDLADGPSSPLLRAKMSLNDFCSLGLSDDRLRLTVPSSLGRREAAGRVTHILQPPDLWPECRIATPNSASAAH
jgi:hypothetical protein